MLSLLDFFITYLGNGIELPIVIKL